MFVFTIQYFLYPVEHMEYSHNKFLYSHLVITSSVSFVSMFLLIFFYLLKNLFIGFPGGPVIENLPTNAGDMRSICGLGRFHMPWGQLSLCTTAEHGNHHNEKSTHHNWRVAPVHHN